MNMLLPVTARLQKRKPDQVSSSMSGTTKADVAAVNVFRCAYDNETMSPVCPRCGVFDARTVVCRVVATDPEMVVQHRTVCGICKMVFQYNRKI